MQIALFTPEYGTDGGGLSFACYQTKILLERLGNVVTVVMTNPNTILGNVVPDENIIYPKVRVSQGGYRHDLHWQLFYRAHLKNILYITRNISFDHVISFSGSENGQFAAEYARIKKAKLIIMLRGSDVNLAFYDDKSWRANKYCLKQAQIIIGLSEELINNSKQIYNSINAKYTVIPNVISVPHQLTLSGKSTGEIKIGCGARNINEKKGITNIIHMVYYLNNRYKINAKAEFIGKIDADLQLKYLEIANQHKIAEKIIIVGELNREEFINHMKSWDYYVQASFAEGFSNSLNDYLRLGKRFLISDTGYIAESLRDYFPELVFDDFDPEHMADNFAQFHRKSNDYDELYKKVYKVLAESANSNKVEKLWRELFDDKRDNNQKAFNYENIVSVVFHDINENTFSNIDTTLRSFTDFVKTIYERGLRLCSVENYLLTKGHKENLIICTFDDGYEGVYRYALPVMKYYGFTATVFVCYEHIGHYNDWNPKDIQRRKHMTEENLVELKTNGWEVGSHGMTHRSLLQLDEVEIESEILESKRNLEYLFDSVDTYAYPYGDFSIYSQKIVKKYYKTAFTLKRGGSLVEIDSFQIRRYSIDEILKIL